MWLEFSLPTLMVLLILDLFSFLKCKFEVGGIACVFKNGELVHAGRDRWVQYKTVVLPVVFKIVFTEPVYSCFRFTGLQTNLETHAIRHSLPEHLFTHILLSNYFSAAFDCMMILCHEIWLFVKVLKVGHNRVVFRAPVRISLVQKTHGLISYLTLLLAHSTVREFLIINI